MKNLLKDITYSIRTLAKHNASLTLIALLTLALGIAANTVVFSAVNSILLQPLPYKDPDNLVMLSEQNLTRGITMPRVAAANFVDWRDQNQIFDDMAVVRFKTFMFTGNGEPEWLSGGGISASLLPLLGVNPIYGRVFLAEEEEPSRSRVAIISYALWKRRFGSDPGLIGQSLMLDTQAHTIVGIMPEGFAFPNKSELWVPLSNNTASPSARRARFLLAIARLKQGVTIEQAQPQMDAIAQQLQQSYPGTNAGWGVKLTLLREETIGNIGRVLFLLLGSVGFVLLIACANVSNLLLARAATREGEFAIRVALGATKGSLIRHLMIESLLLAITGSVMGLLLSLWGISLFGALSPSDLPRRGEVKLDLWVLIFTLGMSLLTGVASGIAPALSAAKYEFSGLLTSAGRRLSKSIYSHRVLRVLIITEVALALVLLSGAGLTIKSVIRLQNVAPGFAPANVLTIRLSLPDSKYPDARQQTAFFEQIIERVSALPGVQECGAVTELPIGGSNGTFQVSRAEESRSASEDQPQAFYNAVSPDYFRAMGIPLIGGRPFAASDRDGFGPKVIIIDEAMAHRFWPNQDAIGRRLTISGKPESYEVVGVAGVVKYHNLESDDVIPAMYVPYLQNQQSSMTLAIRSANDPKHLVETVRSEVKAIDKDQPFSKVSTMEQLLSDSLVKNRFYTALLSGFAFIALVLAAAGIFGILSFSVTQRTHEIGTRMALGARQIDILRLIVKQNLSLVSAGILLGLAGAFVLNRFLSSLLYQVTPNDAVTFISVTIVLIITTLLACYIPAHRATKIDPAIALRNP